MRTKIISFLIIALVFIAGFGYFSFVKNNERELTKIENVLDISSQAKNNFTPKTDNQGEILFTVTPLSFGFEEPIKFEIKIDTHSGSLDFDLVEISFLEDDKGNKYQPLEWQGSGQGGHHRSDTLIFPRLENQPKKIKLTIQDTLSRVFEWDLE